MSAACCKVCGGSRIIEDEELGELVCLDCGAVVDKVIYSKPEWRAFSYEDRLKKERAGAPITPLLHDFGLSTSCPRGDVSVRGDDFMIRVLSEIYRINSSLGFSESVARTAAMLLRKLDDRFKRSRKLVKALPASLLYLSSRIHGIPRTPKELAQYSEATPLEILSCCAKLAAFLKIRNVVGAEAYAARMINDLKLSGEAEAYATRLCELAHSLGLSQGRNPRAIAAASIYLASRLVGKRVSQKRLAEVAGIGLSTLRRRIKEMEPLLAAIKNIRKHAEKVEGENSCRKS